MTITERRAKQAQAIADAAMKVDIVTVGVPVCLPPHDTERAAPEKAVTSDLDEGEWTEGRAGVGQVWTMSGRRR